MNSNKVITRFPPSPTGYCHVGTARMAILNYLFARKHGGIIIFRSEDTDKERSRREYEEDIIEQLHWLGLSWDQFFRTSELVGDHIEAIGTLIKADKAYISEEESKKEKGKIVEVVRLRNPGKVVTFTDVIRGDITFDTTELGDFAIARAVDDPLYHLAVVVDDAKERVTHVIRGEDHISNTPRQILIQEALGYERPVYTHYPLHLGSDKSKLSKRTGDVAVRSYREKGFLPEAMLNHIAVLGWTPPSGKEVLSLEEMIHEFALEDLHKSGAVFDIEKLKWFNRMYIAQLSFEEFESRLTLFMDERGIAPPTHLRHVIPLLHERSETLAESVALLGEYDFINHNVSYDRDLLLKGARTDQASVERHLLRLKELISAIDGLFDADAVKAAIFPYATKEGRAAVLWPLRVALSGKEESPDPFTIASLIGQNNTLVRIDNAIATLTDL